MLCTVSEKMCGTGDTGIVVAEDGFSPESQVIFRLIQPEILQVVRDILVNTRLNLRPIQGQEHEYEYGIVQSLRTT